MEINYRWFMGVVEDRTDPLKLGRVKVRIAGLHTDVKLSNFDLGVGIQTNDLPWAHVSTPANTASINGIGQSPTGIVEGTWVVGFSRDVSYNDLVIIGTLGGISHKTNPSVGFSDPNGVYPKSTHLDESDTNRLARNEKIDETIVKLKKDTIDKNVPTSNGSVWDEPETPYNTVYPFNQVKETECGHIEEFDDTPNAERIHQYHKSGTFKEIHPSGTTVTKIVKDNYNITIGDDYVDIQGSCNITVRGNTNLYVIGDLIEKVDGNVDRNIKGNINEKVEGNVTRVVKGNVKENVEGDVNETVSGNQTLKVTKDITYTGSKIKLN